MMEASELIERLEKATGPDREIDALLWAHFDNRVVRIAYGEVIARKRDSLDDVRLGFVDPTPLRSNFYGWDGEAYTASIDAALALVERVLPGWLYGVRHTSVWCPDHKWAGKPVWEALLGDPGESDSYEPWCDLDCYDEYDEVREAAADHCLPALALCLALLRASPTEEPALPPQAQAASDLQPQE